MPTAALVMGLVVARHWVEESASGSGLLTLQGRTEKMRKELTVREGFIVSCHSFFAGITPTTHAVTLGCVTRRFGTFSGWVVESCLTPANTAMVEKEDSSPNGKPRVQMAS